MREEEKVSKVQIKLMNEILTDNLREEESEVRHHKNIPLGQPVPLTLASDAGWTKKGSGTTICYDSDMGHDLLIRVFTGKIVKCQLYDKKCKLCKMGKEHEKWRGELHPTQFHVSNAA